ncbi:hypothetical protein Dsin_021073 [Dipteronia sinensis]|uniref:Uncharacterized protein n=1 Tax=Dipteronia sinensis TaxID=43782 RepID=A0AAE0E455_9ROSI|nr:hypothetical protein Dsin_021073 [Dipteronia sinensis]
MLWKISITRASIRCTGNRTKTNNKNTRQRNCKLTTGCKLDKWEKRVISKDCKLSLLEGLLSGWLVLFPLFAVVAFLCWWVGFFSYELPVWCALVIFVAVARFFGLLLYYI